VPLQDIPIRVLLAHPDAARYRALIEALPAESPMQVVRVVQGAASLGRWLGGMPVEVLLATDAFADGDTFEVLEAVAPEDRPAAVIIASPNEASAVRAFAARATDFLLEPASDERVVGALLRARQQVLQAALVRAADEIQRLHDATLVATPAGPTASPTAFGRDRGSGAGTVLLDPPRLERGGDGARPIDARPGGALAIGPSAGAASAQAWWPGGVAHGHEAPGGVLDLSAAAGDEPPRRWPSRMLVRDGRRTLFVPLGEVDWFEADGNYVVVRTGRGKWRTRGTMASLEGRLDPARFVRVHRRVLVNMDRVRELTPLPGGDGLLALSDGATLRMSRTYRSRVR
jgi:two-component system LytT family response regulator